jgi:hypothetical protein
MHVKSELDMHAPQLGMHVPSLHLPGARERAFQMQRLCDIGGRSKQR